MFEGNAYAQRKATSQSLAFLDLVPCANFKVEHMAQEQGIS